MEAGETINRLVMVMVADDQAKALGRLLVKQGFRFTLVQAGGLMQTGTVCLLLGTDSARYDALKALVAKACKPRPQYIPSQGQFVMPEGLPPMLIEAQVGSALIYSLPIEYYEVF